MTLASVQCGDRAHRVFPDQTENACTKHDRREVERGGGGVFSFTPGRSIMAIDRRISTTPGRSTLGFRRAGRHRGGGGHAINDLVISHVAVPYNSRA